MDAAQTNSTLGQIEQCVVCSASLTGPDLAQSPTFGTPIRRCPVCRLLQCVGVTDSAIQHLNEHYREKWSAEQISSFQQGSLTRAIQQLQFIESECGSFKNKDAAIDIGAGVGGTCRTLQKIFREVFAVEADPTSREEIKKFTQIDAFPSHQDAAPNISGRMSLVILSHVLEHIPKPVEFCSALVDLLAPYGYFFIEIPNEGQFTEDKTLSQASRTINFGHLNLFDTGSFARMMSTIPSLDCRAITVTGPTVREWFISNKVDANLASDQRGWIRAVYQKCGP